MRTTRFSETGIRRIWMGEPKGFELESGDPTYRFAKERFGHEECESQMPSRLAHFCGAYRAECGTRSLVASGLRSISIAFQSHGLYHVE